MTAAVVVLLAVLILLEQKMRMDEDERLQRQIDKLKDEIRK